MATGSANLPGKFEVGQNWQDLPAAFDAQVSLNLPAEFTVRHEAPQDLPAGFRLRQDVEDLPGEFIVRHSASLELASFFTTQGVRNLPAEFITRHERAVFPLKALFYIQPVSEDLPAEVVVKHETSVDFPAEFEVRKSASLDFPAEFISRHLGTGEIPGAFTVRQEASGNLKANLNITHSEDLPAGFEIRQQYADLAAAFNVRATPPISCEEIIREDDFDAWINYIEPSGTGFLDYPSITDDTTVKYSGENSGKIEVDQLSGSGYKEVTFGWCWMPYRVPQVEPKPEDFVFQSVVGLRYAGWEPIFNGNFGVRAS